MQLYASAGPSTSSGAGINRRTKLDSNVNSGVHDGLLATSKATANAPSPYYGLYSNSGFDMLDILSQVATRPNPTIDLGPIDTSSSFIVVDAQNEDFPIVYVSSSFEDLTGYRSEEVIGRNCRFLQSPTGRVEKGALREFVDNNVVYQLKRSVDGKAECQYITINYKKNGEPFVNLITIIPIGLNARGEPKHFVGFQVDLMKQSGAILRRLADSNYVIDFTNISERRDSQSSNHQQHQLPGILTNTLRGVPSMSSVSSGSPTGMADSPPSSCDTEKPSQDDGDMSASGVLEKLFESGMDSRFPNSSQLSLADFAATLTTADRASPIPGLQFWSSSGPLKHIAPTHSPEFGLSDCELIDASPDFVHILSSRGMILFASAQASTDLLEYDKSELVGHNISKFCHPADVTSLIRELKGARVEDNVAAVYRFKRKRSGYGWMEVRGHKYEMENRKRTKCLILAGRLRGGGGRDLEPMSVHSSGGNQVWARIASNGCFLHVSRNTTSFLPIAHASMYGRSLMDIVHESDRALVSQYVLDYAGAHASDASGTGRSREGRVDCMIQAEGGRSVPVTLSLYRSEIPQTAFIKLAPTKSSALCDGPALAAEHGDAQQAPGDVLYESIFADQATNIQYELNQLTMSSKRIREELAELKKHPNKLISLFSLSQIPRTDPAS
ncbi:PAS domain-containing protein [Gaertneriomyces semiglobifer]|nr:PAS domain-containing protein [Gaertneriomyces semiglobifer]